MIISESKQDHRVFEGVLSRSKESITREVEANPQVIKVINGVDFEKKLLEHLQAAAIDTELQNTFTLVSKLSFPDIIAGGFYGVEAKTTYNSNWKTTGNSIFENTRVEGIQKIYLYCARLSDPFDIIYKNYSDCLSDIVVTHSPRYLVDMKLRAGDSIFDKIDTEYDSFRKLTNPMQKVRDYYKSIKEGAKNRWWLEGDTKHDELLLWKDIDPIQRSQYKLYGIAFFPELFSKSPNKYYNYSLWLLETKSIICPNVRDIFSASGQVQMTIEEKKYTVPQKVYYLIENREKISEILDTKQYKQWRTEVLASLPAYKQLLLKIL